MSDQPLVSVIVPVYNVERYLKDCVESILRQSYKKIELILVNDGSTDSSASLCDAFAQQDNRISVLHVKNSGVSAARNTGIKVCNGEYLLFVDSDDWIDSDMVEKLVAQQAGRQWDAVMFGIQRHLPDGSTSINRGGVGAFPDKDSIATILPAIVNSIELYSPVNKLFRAELVKDAMETHFPLNISLGEDLLFNVEFFRHMNSLMILPDNFYHYRISVMGSLAKRFYPGMDDIFTLHFQALHALYRAYAIHEAQAYQNLEEKYCSDLKNSILLYAKTRIKGSPQEKRAYFRKVRANKLFRQFAQKKRYSNLQWLLVSWDWYWPIRLVYGCKGLFGNG